MSSEPWLILPTYNEAGNVESIVAAAGDVRALGPRPARTRSDRRIQVLPPRGAGSDPFRRRALAGIRLSGRAHLPGGARGLPRGRGADHLPRSPHGGKQDVLAHRRRGDGAGAAPALPLGPALPSRRCCWRAVLQLAAQGADARVVDVSAYAFAHGVRHTRATLLAWQRDPGAVVGRWAAGAAVAAAGLLAAVWVVSSLDVRDQVMALRPPFVVGDGADVLAVLGR